MLPRDVCEPERLSTDRLQAVSSAPAGADPVARQPEQGSPRMIAEGI